MTRTVTTVRRTTPSVWPHRIRQPSIYPTKHNNDSYQSRDEPPVAWSSIAARGPRVDRHSPFTRQVRGQTRGGGGGGKGEGDGGGAGCGLCPGTCYLCWTPGVFRRDWHIDPSLWGRYPRKQVRFAVLCCSGAGWLWLYNRRLLFPCLWRLKASRAATNQQHFGISPTSQTVLLLYCVPFFAHAAQSCAKVQVGVLGPPSLINLRFLWT